MAWVPGVIARLLRRYGIPPVTYTGVFTICGHRSPRAHFPSGRPWSVGETSHCPECGEDRLIEEVIAHGVLSNVIDNLRQRRNRDL